MVCLKLKGVHFIANFSSVLQIVWLSAGTLRKYSQGEVELRQRTVLNAELSVCAAKGGREGGVSYHLSQAIYIKSNLQGYSSYFRSPLGKMSPPLSLCKHQPIQMPPVWPCVCVCLCVCVPFSRLFISIYACAHFPPYIAIYTGNTGRVRAWTFKSVLHSKDGRITAGPFAKKIANHQVCNMNYSRNRMSESWTHSCVIISLVILRKHSVKWQLISRFVHYSIGYYLPSILRLLLRN